MKSFDLFTCALRGAQLIDASAGTGKSYTIIGLVLRVLLEKGLPIEKILVVTYTEAATKELRDKIRIMLRGALNAFELGSSEDTFLQPFLDRFSDRQKAQIQLADSLASFDQAAIYTIHGFCQRMLKEYGLETAGLLGAELIPEDRQFKEEIALDFWRRNFYAASFLFVAYARENFRKDMFGLLDRSYINPDMEVVPESLDNLVENDHEEIENRYLIIFNELCKIWEQERESVPRILLESKALDRRVYKPGKIKQWLAFLDAWARRSQPPIILFEGFWRLTPIGMAEKLKTGESLPVHPFFVKCGELALLQQELTHQYDRRILCLKSKFIRFLGKELPARKKSNNVLAFDDLLTGLHAGLTGTQGKDLAGTIMAKFPIAFIDEFQDTDPIQYDIFSKIYHGSGGALFLIGDPKQAIYSFRGADIFTYMAAAREIKNRHTLSKNYRAVPGLVTAINTLFSHVSNPFLFSEIPFKPVKADDGHAKECLNVEGRSQVPMQICWLAREPSSTKNISKPINKDTARQQILAQTADEIAWLLGLGQQGKALVGSRSVRPKDIAVLVRTNREARMAQGVLASRNIVSVLQSSESIFESHEAVEMLHLLAALADPSNSGRVRAALLTDMLGLDGNDLFRLTTDENESVYWIEKFRNYHSIWVKHGFIKMFRELEDAEQIRARLAAFADGERRITNVAHLAELLHRAEHERRLGMVGLLKFLARQQSDPDLQVDEYQLRLESDAERVRIVTIHKAKGLQYPIVFCPFCWDGSRLSSDKPISYHRGVEGNLVLDLAPDPEGEGIEWALKEELAENLRLLYVCLTRAQCCCYLFWGAFRGADSSALAYLLHQPSDMKESVSFAEAIDALAKGFKRATDDELLADMGELAVAAGGAISCGRLTTKLKAIITADEKKERLALPDFGGEIYTGWKITSFSALIRGRPHAADIPDRDFGTGINTDLEVISPAESSKDFADIFSFPAGARTGNFLHDIFEHLDFQRQDQTAFEELVRQKLAVHGFDSMWCDTVRASVDRVMTTPLIGEAEGLVLADISAGQRLHEMEFYLPLAPDGVLGLNDIFLKYGLPSVLQVPGEDGRLFLAPRRGFLKGFIDLVFQWEGKYYVLDWKSNYLGNSIEQYKRERLKAIIEEECYHLQYHLYTLALHHYLAGRLADYNYEKHFGGVFYLFLRGMNPTDGAGSGVFFDFPDPACIEELSARLVYSKLDPESVEV